MKSRHVKFTFVSLFLIGCLSACDDSDREPLTNDTDTSGTGGQSSDDESTDKNTDNTTCENAATVVGTHGQLHVDGASLKNSCDEYVQLKGVSSMWLNWEYDGYAINYLAMQWMVENWNIQVFRAAMGVDVQYGYLKGDTEKENMRSQVTQIVDNAISLGIYVIIDWHSHNASDYQAEAVAFFTEMAQLYGEYPNVLYETWNEPLEADWETEVKPYHEAVTAAIRAVDPDNIILLGTPEWSQRVDYAIDSPVEGTNLMYTAHFYSCSHGSTIRDTVWNAFRNGVPIFVSEWGATHADGGTDGLVCEDEADEWMSLLNDTMYVSWVAWKLDAETDSSCLLKKDAPLTGEWDNWLYGHGPYVVSKLLEN